MKRIAIYPGSFDPLTNGHMDLIKRALKLFDQVIVGVLENPSKKSLFSAQERLSMVRQTLKPYKRVKVDSFEGLLVNFVKLHKDAVVIRGLRMISDFEYEFQMAQMNRKMYPGFEVVFMMPDERHSYLSSTLVRQIATRGGNVRALCPAAIIKQVNRKVAETKKAHANA
jgi:pantetheine-phosphate adenylyltransferase